MGAIAYLASDYISSLVVGSIAITNEDANYPETSLQSEQIAKATRTTDKVAIKFQFDLGSTKQLQAFFIGNHNFTGGHFDINSYTANDYSTGKITVEDDLAIRLLDQYHRESSAPAARRYWELDFTNCTSGDSYFEIGRIMVYDDVVQLTDVPDFIIPRGYGFKNIIHETAYGARSAVHKLAEKRELFDLKWNQRLASNNIDAELRLLYETVYGNAHPFVFIPDITATTCYYVYISKPDLLYSEIFGTGSTAHVGGIKMTLVEAVRGKA